MKLNCFKPRASFSLLAEPAKPTFILATQTALAAMVSPWHGDAAVGLAISPSIDSSVDTVTSLEVRSRKEGSGSFDGHCVC